MNCGSTRGGGRGGKKPALSSPKLNLFQPLSGAGGGRAHTHSCPPQISFETVTRSNLCLLFGFSTNWEAWGRSSSRWPQFNCWVIKRRTNFRSLSEGVELGDSLFVCLTGFHQSWKSCGRSLSKWAHLARFRTVDKSRLFAPIWPNLTSYERHANIQRGANPVYAVHMLHLYTKHNMYNVIDMTLQHMHFDTVE